MWRRGIDIWKCKKLKMSISAQIPPGGTWFDTHKRSFKDVPVGANQGIATVEFLEAAEATTTLFGKTSSIPTPKTASDSSSQIFSAAMLSHPSSRT